MRMRNLIEPLYKPLYRIMYPVNAASVGLGYYDVTHNKFEDTLLYALPMIGFMTGFSLFSCMVRDFRKYRERRNSNETH